MNPWKPNKTEWATFFVLAPFVNTTLCALLFGKRYFNEGSVFINATLTVLIIVFISWYLHIASMHYLRIKLPAFSQTRIRVFLLAITHLGLASLSMVTFFYGFAAVNFMGYTFNADDFRMSILVGVAITMIATTLWEGEFIFANWKKSVEEKEHLEQLNLQNEFDSLKSQVNPHFLFNCFNTLSSLINEDQEQAEKFLDELSKVYRYLLKNNEDGLTTLQNEIRFIQSYFQLLRTRHGEAIQIQFEVDKKYENYLLPSLSLQLLVENAVKHNMLSKIHPLVIDIFTTVGNKLVVNNNLQKRKVKVPSNKVGIDNIRTKYELLDQEGFQIVEDAKNFTVVLPLLWNNTSDIRHSVATLANKK